MTKKAEKGASTPAPKAPIKKAPTKWKARCLAAEAKMQTLEENLGRLKRQAETNAASQREIDSLKAQVFRLTAEHSPWVKQNNAIRHMIGNYRAGSTTTKLRVKWWGRQEVRPNAVAVVRAIADELGMKV